MAASHGNPDSASLADFFRILRQRWVLITLIVSVVLGAALAVTAFLPKWYLSTTKIRVEKPEGEVKLFQAQGSTSFDPYFQQDQFKILQSEKIIYPVIDNLGLNSKLASLLGYPGSTLPVDLTYRYVTDKMLRIESQRSSSLIDLNVYAQDPALAADMANEIARVYSEDRIALATSEQREGLAQLQKQLTDQEKVVSDQRDAVEKLRKDLNISGVDLNARYSDMEIETLRQMQNSQIALKVDAIGRKTRWEQFKAIPLDQRLTLVNSELIPDANIQNLQQAYLVADQKVEQMKGRLGENHPDFVAAMANRAKIRSQLEALLTGYENSLEISYKEAESRVDELEKQLAQAKVDQILSAREKMRPFEDASQKLDDETRLLTTLKLTLRQREIDFQVPKKTIEILNKAVPSRRPSKPSWLINILAALLFGGVFGVGTAVALEYFDTSFRDVHDVESRLKIPVVGVIPFHSDPLDAGGDPAEIEPYRVLYTNLNLTLKTGQPSTLVVISAGPGEGKSTTLHRLAKLMGEVGEKVLLIDGDLRRPAQHRIADRPKDPGLSDVLSGKASLDQAIQKAISPGLDFIPCGAVPGFTLSLLFADRLKSLISELRGRYDKILIDSPPVIGVSDASVLVTVADGAVLLIQHRRNPARMILRAQQILGSLSTPVMGAILSQVPPHSGEDYGYYTQNYNYYGETGRKPKGTKTQSGSGPDKIVFKE